MSKIMLSSHQQSIARQILAVRKEHVSFCFAKTKTILTQPEILLYAILLLPAASFSPPMIIVNLRQHWWNLFAKRQMLAGREGSKILMITPMTCAGRFIIPVRRERNVSKAPVWRSK